MEALTDLVPLVILLLVASYEWVPSVKYSLSEEEWTIYDSFYTSKVKTTGKLEGSKRHGEGTEGNRSIQ